MVTEMRMEMRMELQCDEMGGCCDFCGKPDVKFACNDEEGNVICATCAEPKGGRP